jgi:hypothetical protein
MAATPTPAAVAATSATTAMSARRLRPDRRNARNGSDQQRDQRFPCHDCLQISTSVGAILSTCVRPPRAPVKTIVLASALTRQRRCYELLLLAQE